MNKMFAMNFTNKIKYNLFIKSEKKNFCLNRSLKTAATRSKTDEQTLEVLNLLKRKVKTKTFYDKELRIKNKK